MRSRITPVGSTIGLWLLWASHALAETVKVTEGPDGTKTTETITHYANTTPWDSAIVILAIAVGLVVIWLGYRLLSKGVPAATEPAIAELEFSLKDKTLRAKNVTQGVLVVLLGSLVIISALYWFGGRGNSSSLESSPPVMKR